jgi:plastocyanin domain-containing protein
VAGVAVVAVGFWNINNGLALSGIDFSFGSWGIANASLGDPGQPVPVVAGVQTVSMKVSGYDYLPSRFTVQAGVPVKWQVDGTDAAGCARVIVASSLGVTKYLAPDKVTDITFTPKEPGRYRFTCSMGMTTPGAAFTVVPQTTVNPVVSSTTAAPAPAAVSSQKLQMEVSYEKGFYPDRFTIKKGVPVEMAIDDKVPLGGCMSVMVIPKYDVTLPFQIGENKLSFTPTETGTVYATCSMGIKLVQFTVTD